MMVNAAASAYETPQLDITSYSNSAVDRHWKVVHYVREKDFMLIVNWYCLTHYATNTVSEIHHFVHHIALIAGFFQNAVDSYLRRKLLPPGYRTVPKPNVVLILRT